MMKKVLSLLLSIMMLVSVCAFAEGTGIFPDVEAEHKNSLAISFLSDKGIINGYEDGTFKPGNPITRGEFVKMLMVYAGNEKANTAGVVTGFPDVDAAEGREAHWAHPYIKTATGLKIINGYPDGTFRPDDNVKLEEAVKMMVCYLNRESVAIERAKKAGADLYPTGYMNVATELLMLNNLSCALGENASRADISQIMYNAKDTKPISNTPVIIGGGGGGGNNNSGETERTLDESVEKRKNWTGKKTGTVIAAAKLDANGEKVQYFIEDDVITQDGEKDTISAYQLIVKMDRAVGGYDYVLFTDLNKRQTYYQFLGQKVEISLRYDGNKDAFFINAISSEQERDTVGTIYSHERGTRDWILRGNTASYNADAEEKGHYGIVYFDVSKDDEATLKLPLDFSDTTVIYNERIVENPAELTIDDFLPEKGSVYYVKENRNDYKLIEIVSKETYVVGNVIKTGIRGIDDKYRKQEGGTTALRLTLDDRDESTVDLFVKNETGADVKVVNIKKGSVLSVASSKCGDFVNVRVITKTVENQKILEAGEDSIIFEGDKSYNYSNYFKRYVQHTLDLDAEDRVKIYLDEDSNIVWVEETEPTYTIGYLQKAMLGTDDQGNEVIEVRILTGGSSVMQRDLKLTNRTKVGTPAVVDGSYVQGVKQRYSNMGELLELLQAKAAAINEGKSGHSINAGVAQPIRFVTSTSNGTIELLETMAFDEESKFAGTPLTYEPILTQPGSYKFSNGAGIEFSAGKDSTYTYMFVPNNRNWETTGYRMGTATTNSISEKLVEYGKYNVDSFFLPNASGVPVRRVFVIYNENIDATPNYRSETVVVEDVKLERRSADDSTQVYKIKPRSGYGTIKGAVNNGFYNTASNEKAYVLDTNFQRMRDENGELIRRAVEPGDVIRFGYTPGNAMINVEIIFDASEPLESRKLISIDKRGNRIEPEDMNDIEPFYYGQLGLITNVPSAPNGCTISTGVGTEHDIWVGPNYLTTSVLLYDPIEDEDNPFATVTMDYIGEGDMIYAWQYKSGSNYVVKYYAVRYNENLLEQVEAETTSDSDSENE